MQKAVPVDYNSNCSVALYHDHPSLRYMYVYIHVCVYVLVIIAGSIHSGKLNFYNRLFIPAIIAERISARV